MFEFHFDPHGDAPVISAIISSPKGKRKVQLILDTGAERTQLHQRTMQRLGYTEKVKTRSAKAIGVGAVTRRGIWCRFPE